MKKTKLLFLTGSILTLALVSVSGIRQIIDAQECRIVRITGGVGARIDAIALEPASVEIGKGSCVVWVNFSPSPDVMIKFEEGKKCVEATDAATGFNPELVLGCYVTGMIRKGATSSLRFNEQGTYEYLVVATPQERVEAKGKIIVK